MAVNYELGKLRKDVIILKVLSASLWMAWKPIGMTSGQRTTWDVLNMKQECWVLYYSFHWFHIP